jgi:Lrp/AsnC family transcriptional regulator, regulator for asnA, asnC and gidA
MLDVTDQKLVEQLQKDGRTSHVTLAKLLGISERTVRNRLRNLSKKGLIQITALPDLGALGYNFTGIIGLQVELVKLKAIATELTKHPNVCYVANVTGRYDFIVIIVAKSTKEFSNIMENFISSIQGTIRFETFVSLKTYKGENGILDTAQLIRSIGILPSNISKFKQNKLAQSPAIKKGVL